MTGYSDSNECDDLEGIKSLKSEAVWTGLDQNYNKMKRWMCSLYLYGSVIECKCKLCKKTEDEM